MPTNALESVSKLWNMRHRFLGRAGSRRRRIGTAGPSLPVGVDSGPPHPVRGDWRVVLVQANGRQLYQGREAVYHQTAIPACSGEESGVECNLVLRKFYQLIIKFGRFFQKQTVTAHLKRNNKRTGYSDFHLFSQVEGTYFVFFAVHNHCRHLDGS